LDIGVLVDQPVLEDLHGLIRPIGIRGVSIHIVKSHNGGTTTYGIFFPRMKSQTCRFKAMSSTGNNSLVALSITIMNHSNVEQLAARIEHTEEEKTAMATY